MIAVIVPIHKPDHWESCYQQYAQQQHEDKCLIVVANGFDASSILRSKNRPTVLATYTQVLGPGRARNEGLALTRWFGKADRFAFFDADDLYLPYYLTETNHYLDDYAACGKGSYVIRDEQTGLTEVRSEGFGNRVSTGGLTGGTISGHLNKAVPFADVPVMEDASWAWDMRAAGHVLWCGSPDHYIKRYFGPGHHTHEMPLMEARFRPPTKTSP